MADALGCVAQALFVMYSVPEMENRQLQRRRSYRDYMVDVPSTLFPGLW